MIDNKKTHKKSLLKRVFGYVAIAFSGLLLAGVLLTLPLRWFNPFTTAFILQEEMAGSESIALDWVPYDDIAKSLPIAIVASEDQKFPNHNGFDFDAIFKALNEDRTKVRGASTISQQLAKNLYLWPGRSLVRKGVEAYLTALIEVFLPKRRILEIYLNVVEFAPGVYGAGAASQKLFSSTADQINASQASKLAAVLPNPKRMSAENPSSYVVRRSMQIQDSVRSLGGAAYLKNL